MQQQKIVLHVIERIKLYKICSLVEILYEKNLNKITNWMKN